mmetsp:Transcript_12081/g.20535  ORF Transcript_12081/g.20535 Transcript_12081/m.20535 type:complete len:640 (-) Transcript_12081:198-2117(-)|eukprot:CAMPEP_0184369650 /NCGR_PEP_ID=MMETSP1089-20130417/162364_1 /TAXON_ID=38269 ORGANISM="Gloeochaete wittrockiana, Strain SAG46.84" /NCGR_SAMPLE_ID=MMETSP1089 /ASSEMBLY_ACC=CAM_ASM_000445 /LENGTH=639 /DNA_ID=CAMNT_0026712123 /DNA_START=30 /DNA_END=1949 /DNA_ORIENTATION=+
MIEGHLDRNSDSLYLIVYVQKARELPRKENGEFFDAFVRLSFKSKKDVTLQTKTVNRSSLPTWNECFAFELLDGGREELQVSLLDENFDYEDLLLSFNVQLSDLKLNEDSPKWWPSESASPGLYMSVHVSNHFPSFAPKRRSRSFTQPPQQPASPITPQSSEESLNFPSPATVRPEALESATPQIESTSYLPAVSPSRQIKALRSPISPSSPPKSPDTPTQLLQKLESTAHRLERTLRLGPAPTIDDHSAALVQLRSIHRQLIQNRVRALGASAILYGRDSIQWLHATIDIASAYTLPIETALLLTLTLGPEPEPLFDRALTHSKKVLEILSTDSATEEESALALKKHAEMLEHFISCCISKKMNSPFPMSSDTSLAYVRMKACASIACERWDQAAALLAKAVEVSQCAPPSIERAYEQACLYRSLAKVRHRMKTAEEEEASVPSPGTLGPVTKLAAGELARAREIYEKILSTGFLAEEVQLAAEGLAAMSVDYVRFDLVEDAISVVERAASALEHVLGSHDMQACRMRTAATSLLAKALLEKNAYDASLQKLEEVLAYERVLYGENSSKVGETCELMGTVHAAAGRLVEARELMCAARDVFQTLSSQSRPTSQADSVSFMEKARSMQDYIDELWKEQS